MKSRSADDDVEEANHEGSPCEDGSWISDENDILGAFHSHFSGLWGSKGPDWSALGTLPGPLVSAEDNAFITRGVSEEEIWEAMRALPGGKA